MRLLSTELRLCFFGWSHNTVYRLVKVQKRVNMFEDSVFPFKKYFVIVFSVISFQLLVKLVANPCDARDNFYNLAQSILWLKAYYNFFLTHNSTEC